MPVTGRSAKALSRRCFVVVTWQIPNHRRLNTHSLDGMATAECRQKSLWAHINLALTRSNLQYAG